MVKEMPRRACSNDKGVFRSIHRAFSCTPIPPMLHIHHNKRYEAGVSRIPGARGGYEQDARRRGAPDTT